MIPTKRTGFKYFDVAKNHIATRWYNPPNIATGENEFWEITNPEGTLIDLPLSRLPFGSNMFNTLPADTIFLIVPDEIDVIDLWAEIKASKTDDPRMSWNLMPTTWFGDGRFMRGSSWGFIRGRKCILIPHNSHPSRQLMDSLYKVVSGLGASGYMYDPFASTNNQSTGERIGTLIQYKESTRYSLRESLFNSSAHKSWGEGYQDTSDRSDALSVIDSYFMPIGVECNDQLTPKYIIQRLPRRSAGSRDSGSIMLLDPARILSSAGLIQIAPIEYWQEHYGVNGKINWTKVGSKIIDMCQAQGNVILSDISRGRGVWHHETIDGVPSFYLNTGTRVYDGEKWLYASEVSIRNRVYRTASGIDYGTPLYDDEFHTLPHKLSTMIEDIRTLSFEHPIMADLLVGWMLTAPVGGALKYRPHLFITGDAGSGKSHIESDIVRKFLGNAVKAVVSKTSYAGLRDFLKDESIPVTWDEAEAGSTHSTETALQIFRVAFIDGGEGQKIQIAGKVFRPRACGALVAIDSALKAEADRSRFITIRLLRPDNQVEFHRNWLRVLSSLDQIGFSDDLGKQAFWYIYRQLPKILAENGILTHLEDFLISEMKDIFSMRDSNRMAMPLLMAAFCDLGTRIMKLERGNIHSDLKSWLLKRKKGLSDIRETTPEANINMVTKILHSLVVDTEEIEGYLDCLFYKNDELSRVKLPYIVQYIAHRRFNFRKLAISIWHKHNIIVLSPHARAGRIQPSLFIKGTGTAMLNLEQKGIKSPREILLSMGARYEVRTINSESPTRGFEIELALLKIDISNPPHRSELDNNPDYASFETTKNQPVL